ncbi:unnamed protein product [Caenorhabditis angaria]|uniref:Aminopeptidase n=1 Tax=Caenorhabditis angaria TaxID=860376 RepID=A0A9P1J5W7_9PELO|nr:unnamed protein product [Caenorhabditis angaria]
MLIIFFIFPLFVFCSEYARLPKTVLPLEYYLKLTVHFDGYGYKPPADKNYTIDGIVSVILNITEAIDRIAINSRRLNFTKENCKLVFRNRNINITSLEFDIQNEQAIFILDQTLEPLKKSEPRKHYLNLTIAYSGVILDDKKGMFRLTYKDENENEKPVIATHFEEINAHQAVPCFDEPWMKAIWRVEITHPVGSIALSNTAEHSIKSVDNNLKTTIFHPTPIMSSYLLAFVISDLEYISDYSESGTLVRAFAPNHQLKLVEFGLKTAVNALNFFEKKYGIKYELSKIDLVPLDQFQSGAMENWGLVTFRSDCLIGENENIESIVQHEIAHQWFGNIVTTEWFSEIWLNEGFATLFDFLQPFRNLFSYTMYGDLHRKGWRQDRPVVIKTLEKKYIDMDGFTSHYKSSQILYMLWKIIGEEKFEEGVTKYLKENLYKSVNSTIFYPYLADFMPPESPSIEDFMNPWLEQVGIPLVIVKQFNSTHNKITQERFDNGVLESYQFPTPKWNYSWYIPLWYRNNSDFEKIEKMIWLKPGIPEYLPNQDIRFSRGLFRLGISDPIMQSENWETFSLNFFWNTALGIQTFEELKHFIQILPNDFSLIKLLNHLFILLWKLDVEVYMNITETQKYKVVQDEKRMLSVLLEKQNGNAILIENLSKYRARITNETISIYFDLIVKDENLAFQIGKDTIGEAKEIFRERCKNHENERIRIIYKQLKKLDDWREKHTNDVLEIVKIVFDFIEKKKEVDE